MEFGTARLSTTSWNTSGNKFLLVAGSRIKLAVSSIMYFYYFLTNLPTVLIKWLLLKIKILWADTRNPGQTVTLPWEQEPGRSWLSVSPLDRWELLFGKSLLSHPQYKQGMCFQSLSQFLYRLITEKRFQRQWRLKIGALKRLPCWFPDGASDWSITSSYFDLIGGWQPVLGALPPPPGLECRTDDLPTNILEIK